MRLKVAGTVLAAVAAVGWYKTKAPTRPGTRLARKTQNPPVGFKIGILANVGPVGGQAIGCLRCPDGSSNCVAARVIGFRPGANAAAISAGLAQAQDGFRTND